MYAPVAVQSPASAQETLAACASVLPSPAVPPICCGVPHVPAVSVSTTGTSVAVLPEPDTSYPTTTQSPRALQVIALMPPDPLVGGVVAVVRPGRGWTSPQVPPEVPVTAPAGPASPIVAKPAAPTTTVTDRAAASRVLNCMLNLVIGPATPPG